MKVRLFGTLGVFGLAVTAATQMFAVPACKAQSDVSPDHFDGTDSWAAPVQTPQPAKPVALVVKATVRTDGKKTLVANIPFAFTAEDITLPAGEYRVQQAANRTPALLIQRTDGSAGKLVTSFAPMMKLAKAQSKLVFERYGERYFLSQVCILGATHGRKPAKSTESPALGKRNEKPEQVVIVARLTPPQP